MPGGFEIGEAFVNVTLRTGSAIAQLGALTAAAGAAGAALAAVPAAGAALAGIGGVLAGSFSGVGDALKAYGKDQENASKAGRTAAKQAVQNARQIRDAQEAIDDARQNASKVARDSARAVSDAERNVREAAEQSAEAIEDAKERQADAAENGAERIQAAEERVQDTQRDAVRAQEGLTRAREDAQRQIEELREATEDFALDEEGAAIRVLKAQERLRVVQRDRQSSMGDRLDAEHDLKVALDAQQDQLRDHKRATEELTKAEKDGVEGSENVIDAKERVADAEEAVADAQKDQQKAVADAAKANQKAAEGVADAVRDGARRQADAEANLAQARESAAEASADAAEKVSDAVQNLADVQADQAAAAEEAAAAANTYQDALAKLLPSQRELVKQLISMGPLVDRLKAASADSFLPGLTEMLRDSEELFPIFEDFLRETGTIMGDVARDMGKLFKSEEFQKDLGNLFDNSLPITQAIGDQFVAMTKMLVDFGGEMDGTAVGFAAFINGVTKGFEGFFEKLKPYDDDFKLIWESLGRIMEVVLPAVGEALGKLAEIFAPIWKSIADFLTDHREELDEWLLLILGFYAALKGFQVVAGVSRMVGGVIAAWGLLPAAARTAALRVAGAFAFIGLADTLLPEVEGLVAADPFSSFRAYTDNQREDISDLWAGMLDPGAALEDLKAEFAAFPDQFANSPFMQFFGTTIPKWWDDTWNGPNSISASFTRFGEDLKRQAGEVWDGILGGFQEGAAEVGRFFVDSWNGLVTWFKDFFGIASPSTMFFQFGMDILTGFINGIAGMPAAAGQVFLNLWNTASTWFTNLATSVGTWSQTMFNNFLGWVSQLPQTAYNWFQSTWQSVTDWMGSIATGVWDGARSIYDNFIAWVSLLPNQAWDWFTKTADNIGQAWDRIKEIAAAPIRFVVNTVINDGIIAAWNWLVDKVGIGTRLDDVVLPFAKGGPVMGPTLGLVGEAGPEYILSAPAVRAMGGMGAAEELHKSLLNGKSQEETGGPNDAVPGGVGWQNLWNIINRQFPAARLTSSVRRGDPGYHGRGLAIDIAGPRSMDTAYMAAMNQWIARSFPGSTELIYTPGINLHNGKPHTYKPATRADHFDHVHWALGAGGTGIAAPEVVDLWDAIGGEFTNLIGNVRNSFDQIPGAGMFSEMIKGVPGKMIDNTIAKAKSWLESLFGGGGGGTPGTGPVADQVRAVAASFGWSDGPQWAALDRLIQKESSWNPLAQNPTSTAYGLFQFLNSTWRSVGGSKTSNPGLQAQYGLQYIKGKYRDPMGALAFHNRNNWYDNGGFLPTGTSVVHNGTGKPERVLTDQQWDKVSGGITINIGTLTTPDAETFVRDMKQRARQGRKGRSA